MLDSKSEQQRFYFTEQFNGKTSHFFLKKSNYIAIDKKNHIRVWLGEIADRIMDDRVKYDDIYKAAKKISEDKEQQQAEIASYEINPTSSIEAFPLPEGLSVQEIAEELFEHTIEVTMENEENPFHGCRLKLRPFYGYEQGLKITESPMTNAMILGAIMATPNFVVDTVVQGQHLSGFIIELDVSPRSMPKCSIS